MIVLLVDNIWLCQRTSYTISMCEAMAMYREWYSLMPTLPMKMFELRFNNGPNWKKVHIFDYNILIFNFFKFPDMLFGQMPVLVVDGHESIAQSAAISRFLARQYGIRFCRSVL
jgi:hypothetical protein